MPAEDPFGLGDVRDKNLLVAFTRGKDRIFHLDIQFGFEECEQFKKRERVRHPTADVEDLSSCILDVLDGGEVESYHVFGMKDIAHLLAVS